ncbi:uncharacterized protein LOC126680182 [Mercurialis annua]|uniref:uncharacterized protein LOC126680182 n=1 Tax=Mercurialis annua TaxID=3986 RepID=UPI00215FF845|nr:uncharacterized protein LOC126680182 [Mercurialis annua]XP_050231194.1 uncharacterized protein LOC126680182 [Mercurialis annua]XP_050231195.1 uncharacterized protein LOC126680182 [Mercurialis annua]
MDEILGNNSIEDVSWLCLLSESELDMLISLKMLVIQRAKVIGHGELASKFDLKMLRALALVLMEYLKGNMKNLTHIPGLANSPIFMDGCSLLQCKLCDLLSIEELKTCIDIHEKKKQTTRN